MSDPAQTAMDVFSGLALWLVPATCSSGVSSTTTTTSSSCCDLTGAIEVESAALRASNAGRCSAAFGVHATLLAGLGDRTISADGLAECARQAVEAWRGAAQTDATAGGGVAKAQREDDGEMEGLSVALTDVVTKGKYFQVRIA